MNELTNVIARDIEERRSAIYKIERIFFTGRFNFSQPEKDVVLIHTIPMLYSLWEGYVTFSIKIYINWMNTQSLDYDLLKSEIVINTVEKKFKQFKKYPEKISQKKRFFDNVKEFFTNDIFSISNEVNTESNVSFNVLNRLMNSYTLELFTEYYKEYKHPNNLKSTMDDFLNYRNGISHGSVVGATETITHEVFEKYKNLVFFLMDEVHMRIDYGVKKNTHLL